MHVGLPLITLVVVGSVGLSVFVQGKYDIQDAKVQVVDERAPVAKQRAKKFDLQEELQRLKEHADLNSYENKPVPRPKDW